MRFITKLVILGLAAIGAYRLYELAQGRAGQLRESAGPPVGDAIDTMKTTATKVKDDLAEAQADVVDDLQAAVRRTEKAAGDGEPRMAVAGDRADPSDRV
jgi:hypothetical protein